ncbi:MAG: anti-sigma factor family protein [Eubacteriales bacterium]
MSDIAESETMRNPGLIRCDQIRDLFSPWLDNEISGKEKDLVAGHLLTCDSCREEKDLWKRISETLKSDIISGEPSPDFCAGVISKIHKEIHNNEEIKAWPGRRLLHIWRGPAAAAAVAVMLFAGSWGVKVALYPERPTVAINQPSPNFVTEDNFMVQPEKITQPDSTDRMSESGTAGGVPNTVNTAGDPRRIGQPDPVQPNQGGNSGSGINTGATDSTVLLSTNRDVLSTILWISTANAADKAAKALDIASRLGGGGQVLSTQRINGIDLTIIRITVPRESGGNLTAQLSGLDRVIDRSDERKDISASYTEYVNRLKDIQARTGVGINSDEKSQLAAEASGLKRQIESWNQDLGSYVVILRLEQK